jgi:hypothetical protein
MPWIDYALNFVKTVNKLNHENDVKLIYSGHDFFLTDYINYFKENPGRVNIGIVFCND